MNDFLKTIRVYDEQGRLSLSNLGLVAILVKVLLAPTVAVPDLLALAAMVVNYRAKDWSPS